MPAMAPAPSMDSDAGGGRTTPAETDELGEVLLDDELVAVLVDDGLLPVDPEWLLSDVMLAVWLLDGVLVGVAVLVGESDGTNSTRAYSTPLLPPV